MVQAMKAVIFDMDGVLIESEYLWRIAMIKGFEEFGISLTEEDCRKTMGLRIGEVIELWLNHFHITHVTGPEIEKRILELLLILIEEKGIFIDGIPELLNFCTSKNIKMGLATSSSHELMHAVLKKLQVADKFEAIRSAEFMPYGKPHPEVFISCAKALGIAPQQCLVIEDSVNGVIAGKAAQMSVIAVPDTGQRAKKEFAAANYVCENMHQVLALFKTLFP
jgi:sugar-phosphatase